MGEAWVDPARLEVVSFELESKGRVSSTVTGCVPLTTLKQIGDVVLVQDESAATGQQLDSRFGFVKLLGMEVRTRSGKVLGKVRDIAFSPDNGAISKVEFDDFGLRFLPVNFFDTFSVPAELIDSVAYGAVVVATEGEGQRQEKQGILSSVLRGGGGGRQPQVAGLLTDGGRGDGGAPYLPQGYSYEQWQADIRRWEMETGIKYEEYMTQNQQYGSRAARNALPARAQAAGAAPAAGQRFALPPPAAAAPGGAPAAAGRARMGQPPQQQQPYGSAPYGAGPQQQYGVPPQQQQPAQQGYGAGPQQQGYGGGSDPRYRGPPGGAPPGGAPRYAPPPQQQQSAGWAQQQPAQQQPQQPAGWPAPPGGQQRQGGGAPRAPGGGGGPPPQAANAPQGGLYSRQGAPAAAGAGPGPAQGGPEAAGGPGAPAQGGAAALRVDEWLAREGAGPVEAAVELGPGQGPARQAEVGGWDGPARQPY